METHVFLTWKPVFFLPHKATFFLDQRFSNTNMQQTYLDGLLKHRFLSPTLRICDSVDLVWAQKCISHKFPDDGRPTL